MLGRCLKVTHGIIWMQMFSGMLHSLEVLTFWISSRICLVIFGEVCPALQKKRQVSFLVLMIYFSIRKSWVVWNFQSPYNPEWNRIRGKTPRLPTCLCAPSAVTLRVRPWPPLGACPKQRHRRPAPWCPVRWCHGRNPKRWRSRKHHQWQG